MCKNTPRRSKKDSKIFKDITKQGNSMPSDGEMLRKGVLTVARKKALFSTDQLVQVCEHMFDALATPYRHCFGCLNCTAKLSAKE